MIGTEEIRKYFEMVSGNRGRVCEYIVQLGKRKVFFVLHMIFFYGRLKNGFFRHKGRNNTLYDPLVAKIPIS